MRSQDVCILGIQSIELCEFPLSFSLSARWILEFRDLSEHSDLLHKLLQAARMHREIVFALIVLQGDLFLLLQFLDPVGDDLF
jgi:hypothetical protein